MVKRVMYIYKDTHLPRDGWLQGCFVCCAITGRSQDYQLSIKVPDMRFVLYCCPFCCQVRKKSTELESKIQEQLQQYVANNLASG
jgi:hypothetical protein